MNQEQIIQAADKARELASKLTPEERYELERSARKFIQKHRIPSPKPVRMTWAEFCEGVDRSTGTKGKDGIYRKTIVNKK